MFHLVDKTGQLFVTASYRSTHNILLRKHKILISTCVCMLIFFTAGCRGPQLASRSLSQQEKEWIQAMHEFYPGWKPPRYPPRLNTGSDSRQSGISGRAEWSGDPELSPSEKTNIRNFPGTEEKQDKSLDSIELVPVGVSEDSINTNGEGVRQYRVQKGDNLSKIARKFYDTAGKWRKIYNANKGKMSSPDDLTTGMELDIPPE